ncbi:hypothetical protein X772_07395 [Mesorhizobium sp. LSJC280B00]|nr:hypothetical protein X772_07395 [Mesorhizobium sp. LSJC280B00]
MHKGGGFKPSSSCAGKADADFSLHRLKRDVNMA